MKCGGLRRSAAARVGGIESIGDALVDRPEVALPRRNVQGLAAIGIDSAQRIDRHVTGVGRIPVQNRVTLLNDLVPDTLVLNLRRR